MSDKRKTLYTICEERGTYPRDEIPRLLKALGSPWKVANDMGIGARSIRNWLENNGYTQDEQGRWISPTGEVMTGAVRPHREPLIDAEEEEDADESIALRLA
jgi:hypothetical protein